MANLEVQIGADNSEFNKKIAEVEKDIKELSQVKLDQIKLGLDTKEIDANIKDAKKSLNDLKSAMKDTGTAFQGAAPKVANAGHTLTQFSRIAQDAPFGIMGIGNNLTATAEAFSNLSKESGGAGNALKAVVGSLMGGGGILLAISLVTTALTVMSQKGLTVSDVFNKLTGNFDAFGQELKKVNQEAAKNAAEQVASVGAYVSVAKDINLSMQERLIAVKKLQDEYPAFFGNLSKEQILNGNVANAVNEVVAALKAKARAQAYAGKLGDLAAKEVELRDKEAVLIKQHNETLKKRIDLEKQLSSSQFSEATFKAWQQADRAVKSYSDDLKDVQNDIRANIVEMNKWAAKSTIEVKASIKLDFKEEKLKKVKILHEPVEMIVPVKMGLVMPEKFDIGKALSQQYKATTFDPLASLNERMEASRIAFINRLKNMVSETKTVLFSWNDVIGNALSNIGTSIGEALASGGNALQAVGSSLLSSISSLLSSIGDKLITVGVTAVIAGTALETMFTPAGIAAGLAAIAVGTALKVGSGFTSGLSKNISGGGGGNNNISAGNSVSTPTSSINNVSSGGGFQNVVFEISGQSLVGVLSNTLNKNVKLGGVPAI